MERVDSGQNAFYNLGDSEGGRTGLGRSQE